MISSLTSLSVLTQIQETLALTKLWRNCNYQNNQIHQLCLVLWHQINLKVNLKPILKWHLIFITKVIQSKISLHTKILPSNHVNHRPSKKTPITAETRVTRNSLVKLKMTLTKSMSQMNRIWKWTWINLMVNEWFKENYY